MYLGLGKFETVRCSGVLHHLKSPNLGLKLLKDTLLPTGGMSLMVYSKYGRTAIYHIQDLVSKINGNLNNVESEIENTQKALKSLPKTNWFIMNAFIDDHKTMGMVGIYDYGDF